MDGAQIVKRIRSQKLVVFRSILKSVPFEVAVSEVDERNLVMASNKRLTEALANPAEWRGEIRSGFGCHAGTNTAYIEPDAQFDENSLLVVNDNGLEKIAGTRYFVEYLDQNTRVYHLFPVHPDHLGKKNAILVAEHPDYVLHTGDNRIITLPAGMELKKAVDLVEGFPKTNGWRRGDPDHNIPVFRTDGPDLYLCRVAKRVGPVRRNKGSFGLFGGALSAGELNNFVCLNNPPSTNHGVIVEGTVEQLAAAIKLFEELKQ